MPRILRIINRLNLGGPTYNASYLSKYLAPKYETLLVSGVKDEAEESSLYIPESLGLEPVFIKDMERAIQPIKDYRAYKEIVRLIKEFKPDIVHTHAAKAGALGRLAAIHQKVPVIVHTFHGHVFHSYFGAAKTRVFLEIERYLAHRSSAIVAISAEQRRELRDDFRIAPDERFATVPLGFDLSRFQHQQAELRAKFRQEFQLKEDEFCYGIIGRLTDIKNHEMFLRVAQQMRQLAPKSRAIIIGGGEKMDSLQEHAEQLSIYDRNRPLESHVLFTSWVHDIERATVGLDTVVLSSFNEGTPVSLIEAQASGRPVVSTQVGGVQDTLLEGQSGFLCAVDDDNSMVEHLLTLYNDPALRQKMGAIGADFAHKGYSYQRLVADMDALYSRLLK